MKKVTYFIPLFTTLFLLSCNSNKELKFILPNGDIVKQTSIWEIEKDRIVHFEHYYGFVLDYQDGIFINPLLNLGYEGNAIKSDVLSDEKINELKFKIVQSLEFSCDFPNQSDKRNFNFEQSIKDKYSDFDEVLSHENGFELRRKGQMYVEIKYYTNNINSSLYHLIIYPKEQY